MSVIASRFLKNGVAIYVDLGDFFWGLGCGLGAVSLQEFAKHKCANSWLSKGKFAFKFIDCHARLMPYFDINFSPQNSVQRLLHQLF